MPRNDAIWARAARAQSIKRKLQAASRKRGANLRDCSFGCSGRRSGANAMNCGASGKLVTWNQINQAASKFATSARDRAAARNYGRPAAFIVSWARLTSSMSRARAPERLRARANQALATTSSRPPPDWAREPAAP